MLLTLEDPPVEGIEKYTAGTVSPGGTRRPAPSGGGTLAALGDGRFWADVWGGIKECASHLRKRVTFLHLAVGVMIQVGVGLSIMAFLPVFLVRVHHMTTKSAGLNIAEIGGVFGGVGIVTGGIVSDWLVRRSGDQRWMLWFILACNVVAAPLMVVAVLVDSRETSIVISSVVVALFMVMVGPPGALCRASAELHARYSRGLLG